MWEGRLVVRTWFGDVGPTSRSLTFDNNLLPPPSSPISLFPRVWFPRKPRKINPNELPFSRLHFPTVSSQPNTLFLSFSTSFLSTLQSGFEMRRERVGAYCPSPAPTFVVLIILLVGSVQFVQCQNVDDYSEFDNPELLPLFTQLVYGQISNMTTMLSAEFQNRSSFCVKDPWVLCLVSEKEKKICWFWFWIIEEWTELGQLV